MKIPTPDTAPEDRSRRDFLRSGAAMATLTLAPGVTLMAFGGSPAQGAVDSGKRWGLLIDASKCAPDCTACITACQDENGWKGHGDPERDVQWIRKVTLKDKNSGRETSLPVMCQHCEEPPCVDVCPTGASFKRDDGIVLVDKHICIGCRYCMMACPFKARSFIHEPVTNQAEHAPRGQGTVRAEDRAHANFTLQSFHLLYESHRYEHIMTRWPLGMKYPPISVSSLARRPESHAGG